MSRVTLLHRTILILAVWAHVRDVFWRRPLPRSTLRFVGVRGSVTLNTIKSIPFFVDIIPIVVRFVSIGVSFH